MKYVTIATDISSDPKLKITTWACYIRHSGGVIKQVGEFKKHYSSTATAETYALVNALTIAEKNIRDWSESKVIIYNEIEHSLRPIRTKNGTIRERDALRSEAILKIALPILLKAKDWEKRDIKAHYGGWKDSDNPAKYAINRWCDNECRTLLKGLRRMKYRQQNT